jgi:hypothetical protein
MRDNKILSYLLYALAEIILVVIGILITPQISAWGNSAETAEMELKILKEISTSLENDLFEIREDIGGMNSIKVACIALKKAIRYQQAHSFTFDSNASIVPVIPHFDPNKSGYGILVSKGLERC